MPRPTPTISRHRAESDLAAAKSAYQTARMTARLSATADNYAVLLLAERRLARARRVFAPFARADRAAAAAYSEHARRYHYQLGRRSRTLDTGAALRRERAAKARAAARVAAGKRARNLAGAGVLAGARK